jgi:hypothetical protein
MAWRCMQASCLVIASAVAVATSSYADSATSARRDSALKGIEACLRRNEVSSRECKNLNKDVQPLVDVYRQGDTARKLGFEGGLPAGILVNRDGREVKIIRGVVSEAALSKAIQRQVRN